MAEASDPRRGASGWRLAAAVALGAVLLGTVASLGPVTQDVRYHAFADTRAFLGIPNFLDIVTNLPFLAVGLAGVRRCLRGRVGPMRDAWLVLFAGVALVSAGSVYYHWSPGDAALAWDRLPMTMGFMGLFVALLGEYLGSRRASPLLVPAVLLGLGSVVYWRVTGDLRPYIAVQLAPLAAIPLMVALLRGSHTHQWLLFAALGAYALAKVAEAYDAAIFSATGETLSGHSLKHLLAATACGCLLLMLSVRRPLAPRRSP